MKKKKKMKMSSLKHCSTVKISGMLNSSELKKKMNYFM